MKLGYMIGYWGAGPPTGVPDALAEAERLGFDSCWTAEAYGSDALTPLAWWGARPQRIKLGTSICQLSARTPTAMAMAALTLDHLSGGRFVLGLGASGPQVAEGWYGDDYRRPLARTREYVEIVRQVLAREKPVEFHGERYQLPHSARDRTRQAAEVDRAPVARRPPDLPRGRRPEERRARRPRSPTVGSRCSTRRAPTASTATRSPKDSRARRAAQGRRVRSRVPRPDHRRRRRRGRGQLLPTGARALHRRHGRPRGQLPQRRVRAHGLPRRGEAHPGPLPRGQEGPRPRPRCRSGSWRMSRSSGPRKRSATTSSGGGSRRSPR